MDQNMKVCYLGGYKHVDGSGTLQFHWVVVGFGIHEASPIQNGKATPSTQGLIGLPWSISG